LERLHFAARRVTVHSSEIMMRKRVIPLLTAALSLALLLPLLLVPSCRKESGANPDAVVIGEFASLTGGTADFGTSSHGGLALAIQQANEKGGVLGKQVTLIHEDDRSDVTEAVNVVQKLVNRDNVLAVIGEVASKRSLAGGNICQKYKTPMLSPASTNPAVTVENGKVKDYVFRICFTDDFQGMINGKFAADQGWRRVAVMTNQEEDYSKGLSAAFKQAFTSGGGQIVAEAQYTNRDKDFKALLNNIKNAKPDAVYVPGYYTEIKLLIPQARQIGITVPFFGGDGWDSPETLAIGADAEGCFFSDHYSAEDPSPKVQAFVQAYQKAYGKTPDAMAALGYDAGGVILKAVADAGKSDRQAVRDALAKITDFDGVTGRITIDENHNARKPIVVLRITGGKAKLHKTFSPDGAPVEPGAPAPTTATAAASR
jgi:branched-chain amino acid transport system substrate-binding protein